MLKGYHEGGGPITELEVDKSGKNKGELEAGCSESDQRLNRAVVLRALVWKARRHPTMPNAPPFLVSFCSRCRYAVPLILGSASTYASATCWNHPGDTTIWATAKDHRQGVSEAVCSRHARDTVPESV